MLYLIDSFGFQYSRLHFVQSIIDTMKTILFVVLLLVLNVSIVHAACGAGNIDLSHLTKTPGGGNADYKCVQPNCPDKNYDYYANVSIRFVLLVFCVILC